MKDIEFLSALEDFLEQFQAAPVTVNTQFCIRHMAAD